MYRWSREHSIRNQQCPGYAVSRDTVGSVTVGGVQRTVIACLAQCEVVLQVEIVRTFHWSIDLTWSDTRVVGVGMKHCQIEDEES